MSYQPVVDSGHIHAPVSTQDLQCTAGVNVLSFPHGYELRDDEGVTRIPHVLPGNTWQTRMSQDVSVAQTYVALREWPVLLSATCRCRCRSTV